MNLNKRSSSPLCVSSTRTLINSVLVVILLLMLCLQKLIYGNTATYKNDLFQRLISLVFIGTLSMYTNLVPRFVSSHAKGDIPL